MEAKAAMPTVLQMLAIVLCLDCPACNADCSRCYSIRRICGDPMGMLILRINLHGTKAVDHCAVYQFRTSFRCTQNMPA